MWGFTSALLIKPEAFTMELGWAHKDECRTVCVQWISSSKSVSCYYLLCETPMGTSTEMAISTILHKGPTSRIMLSKISVLDANKCTCTIPYKRTYTNLHIHTDAGTRTHAITEHGRDYNIFSLSQIRQDQIISLLWCQLLLSNAGFSNNTRFIVGSA